MNYYKLYHSIDIKEVGAYPQGITPAFSGNIRDLSFNKPIEIDSLPEPTLHRKAKRTTFLDTNFINNNIFNIFKKNYIDFLEKFKIPKSQKWKIKVHHDEVIIKDYILFRIAKPSDKVVVNYKKSEFYLGKVGDWKNAEIKKEKITIKTNDDYYKLNKFLYLNTNNSRIRCDKLVLNISKLHFDMFRLIDNPILKGYIVSERLKCAILKNQFTGMSFKKIEEISTKIIIED